MKPLLPASGTCRRSVMFGLAFLALLAFSLASFAFFMLSDPALQISVGQAFVLAFGVLFAGGLWLLHGRLSQHFDGIEALRSGILVTSAHDQGTLPPPVRELRFSSTEEGARLRAAVETLIARRLHPNATADERLKAVLGSLDEGILVITQSGQVSLINEAARALLGQDRIGVGRSVFSALERESLVAALSCLEGVGGSLNWTLSDVDGTVFAAKLAPLSGHSGVVIRLALEGLILRRPNRMRGIDADDASRRPAWDGNVICLTRHREQVRDDEVELPLQGGAVAHDFSLHDELPVVVMGPETPLDDLPVMVFDVESTGLNTQSDRIVQVGGVRLHGGQIFQISSIDRLIHPARPIPPEATAVHGISDDMVADAMPFAALWPSLEPLMRGAVLVGHNIGYDVAMVRRECELAGIPFDPPPILDTLLLAGMLLPDIGQLNLENVARTLGVDIHGRHTALGDSLVTAEVYVRMIPLLQANNIHTYAQAYAYTRRARHLIARQRAMGW